MGLKAPAPLAQTHDSSTFYCGQDTLNNWLKNTALKNEKNGGSRTFVVREGKKVIAYYTLAAGSVSYSEVPGKVRRNMPEPIPVMMLGRLAVDKSHQSKGIGKALLRDAMLRVIAISKQAGVKAMMLHALTEEIKRFYLRQGFIASPTNEMTLMIPTKEAIAHLDVT